MRRGPRLAARRRRARARRGGLGHAAPGAEPRLVGDRRRRRARRPACRSPRSGRERGEPRRARRALAGRRARPRQLHLRVRRGRRRRAGSSSTASSSAAPTASGRVRPRHRRPGRAAVRVRRRRLPGDVRRPGGDRAARRLCTTSRRRARSVTRRARPARRARATRPCSRASPRRAAALGLGLASVVNLFDLDAVVLGGCLRPLSPWLAADVARRSASACSRRMVGVRGPCVGDRRARRGPRCAALMLDVRAGRAVARRRAVRCPLGKRFPDHECSATSGVCCRPARGGGRQRSTPERTTKEVSTALEPFVHRVSREGIEQAGRRCSCCPATD